MSRFGGRAMETNEDLKLTASDPGTDDGFGSAVSISGDTVLVGAHTKDNGPDEDAGAVYECLLESSPPEIALPGGGLSFTENDGATVIDSGAQCRNLPGLDLTGGNLTVDFTLNGTVNDRLGVNHVGSGAGQIGVTGSDVQYEGTTIGTMAGATDGSTPLVITLNADANATNIQAGGILSAGRLLCH